jgi:hypothetical protein
MPTNEFVFNEKSLKIYANLFIIIHCWANVQRSNAVVVGDNAGVVKNFDLREIWSGRSKFPGVRIFYNTGVDDANASATADRHAVERIPYLCPNQ